MPVLVDDRTPESVDFDSFWNSQSFTASVTITRTSPPDYQTRQLVVSIDGERVATLLWGDSVTRELAPGRHRMRVHNTLVWKDLEFTLAPGEQLYFEAINRAGAGTLVMTVLFGIGPLYVTIQRM